MTVVQGLHLGLTGGIGSGKSTVARMLADMGAVVVDADAISRSLTAPGGTALPTISATFGKIFLDNNGALDRARMRDHVFAHPEAKRQLEAIIHPLVLTQTLAAVTAAGTRTVVLDIPLLTESGHWRQRVDAVLVVDCDEVTQVERVMARNGLEAQAVRSIISAQASRAQRLAIADAVIYNQNLSFVALQSEVFRLGKRFGL